MRILIDARMYGLENSGIGRYLINLVDEIIKLDTNNEYIIFLKSIYYDQLRMPSNWKKIKCDLKHYSIQEQTKLVSLITKLNPDLVHFPHFNVPYFYKGKYVVTIHDMTMHFQGFNATNLPLYKYIIKRVPYKMIFRNAVKKSNKIIVPSNYVKNLLKDYFNISENKIDVIYEGYREILSEKYKASEIDILAKYNLLNKNYFFYVGNAYPHKNLKIAIEAIKKINKKNNDNYRFVIAGSRNVFTERIKKQTENMGMRNFVDFLGFVRDSELTILYKHSQGFIYPSMSEGFGLQGLEAMSSGALLVASDINVFREIYGNNAIFFRNKDTQSCTLALEQVISMNRNEKNLRIINAKEFIKKYSWKKMAEETLSVYENCNSI